MSVELAGGKIKGREHQQTCALVVVSVSIPTRRTTTTGCGPGTRVEGSALGCQKQKTYTHV